MNPRLLASLLAGALGAAGVAFVALRGDECVTCDGYSGEAAPVPVTLVLRGQEVADEADVEASGVVVAHAIKCSAPYACSPLKSATTVHSEADSSAPSSGAACRAADDAEGECEWSHPNRDNGKWLPAPWETTLAEGTHRGPCLPTLSAEHGALTLRRGEGYGLNAKCWRKPRVVGGPGKLPPVGVVVEAEKVVEVPPVSRSDADALAIAISVLAIVLSLSGCAHAPAPPRCDEQCLADRAAADARHCGCRDLCADWLCDPPATPWRDAP